MKLFYSLEESLLLLFCQLHILPFLEFPECDILDPDAFQALHGISADFDHFPNLTVFSFFQDNGEFPARDTLHATRSCLISGGSLILSLSFFQRNDDTLSHSIEMGIIDWTERLDHVFFLVFVARMHEVVRKAPIIREEDESRRFLIEAPDRKDSLWDIDDIEKPCFTMRYTGTHDPIGLIHLIIDEFSCIFHDRVSDFHDIFLRIDDLTGVSDDSIYRDFSICDILLRFPTRADTGM